MTQERRPEQQISNEVVGRLTDSQKQELTVLGLSIIDAKRLNPKNPQHAEQAKGILEDCVYRGLDIQHRTWFSPAESVSPIFELGLGQRESVVDQLKRISSTGTYLKYVTSEEATFTSHISPLDPDFTQADELLNQVKGRRTSVSKFHQSLFEESQLAPEARALKSSIDVVGADRNLTEQDKAWVKNNRLFSNLLVNLALYQQIGLTVEPKDIAALSEIWHDLEARNTRQAKLVDRMKQAAKNLGLPEGHIEAYTRSILDDLNVTLAGGKVTLEELQGAEQAEQFAIPTQAMQEESLEFEQADDEAEHRTIYVPEEDLVEARGAINKIREFLTRVDKLAEETADQEDAPEDDELNQYVENDYIPFVRQLIPLELTLIYQIGLKDAQTADNNDYARIEEELQEFVPFNTYLEALNLLQAVDIRVAETGGVIPELQGANKDLVYLAIKREVLQRLLEEKFDQDTTYDKVIGKLPTVVLAEYVERVDPANLPIDHIEVLTQLDVQKWFSLALERGVHAEADPNKSEEIKLAFDSDSEFLRGYIERMSIDKQQAIARKLQHIIVF